VVVRGVDGEPAQVRFVAGLEPGRLPDSALSVVPVLLGRERLAEAAASEIVRNAGVDAEHEAGLAGDRLGEVDFDWHPTVAMGCDLSLVDSDDPLVEHPLHHKDDAFAGPCVGQFDELPVSRDSPT